MFITGAVAKPGQYEFVDVMTISDAIKLAGGILPIADARILLISGTQKGGRGRPVVREVNFDELTNDKTAKLLPALQSGDQLVVRGR